MSFKDTLRSLTPQFFLDLFRANKKKQTRKKIEAELKAGNQISEVDLINQIKNLGIEPDDDVLVHCAFSKLGAVEGGPQTLVTALQNVIGEMGNLLMPSSPNASFQLEYVQNIDVFDVENTPSRMGALSEVFRSSPDVQRSAHPTEPICAWGKDATWYVENHETDGTAYGKNSPFFKLTKKKGKILYIGVTLDNAGTSLHASEDAIPNFKYPVYEDEVFTVKVKNRDETFDVKTKVHNPDQSKKRQCDGLLPMFVKAGVAKQMKLGTANTWVFDAEAMLSTLVAEYENGVTMYTPLG